MVQVKLSESEFNALEGQSLNDLYADLAITDAGTAGSLGLDLESLGSIKAVMAAEDASPANIASWLISKGKALFNQLWPAAKAVVCQIYGEDKGDTDLKGWVARVAAAIVGLLNITAAAAILVVTIALKLGLDALCDTGSEQPA
jgi:hypothetical protein